jgi:hypothetical protein
VDFTIKKYKELLLALRQGGYEFVPFRDYIVSHEPASIPAMALENSQTDNKYTAAGTATRRPMEPFLVRGENALSSGMTSTGCRETHSGSRFWNKRLESGEATTSVSGRKVTTGRS